MLKPALRFLGKHKVFAIINGLGLTIAMTVSFIILLYVINEYSYDRYHKKGKRIYRVVNFYKDFNITQLGTPYILASTLKDEFPQVENSTTLRQIRGFGIKVGDEYIDVRKATTAGIEIFEIFDIPLISGSPDKHLLENLNSIVLSYELAQKIFPGENAAGREILCMVDDKEYPFVITGIFENIPLNSTLQAECFIHRKWSVDPVNKAFGITNADESWEHDLWTTWVLLKEGSRPEQIDKQFDAFGKKYINDQPHNIFSLQKLHDVYLRSDNVANTGIRGNIKSVRLFSFIALLIVLVAAINYTTLSTALTTIRSREIGIRKTFGAASHQIRNQMLRESVIMVVIILPVALVLTWLALPHTGRLFQKELLIMDQNLIAYIVIYIAITILIGISSGWYTSSYLSRLRVLDIMKNATITGKGKARFRSALIIIQLLIFCSLVGCILTLRAQYLFALNKETGHHKKDIIQIDLGYGFPGHRVFLNSIRSNSNVIDATGVMEGIPMLGSMSVMMPDFEDKNKQVKVEGLTVDYGFVETMGLEVIEGRSFSEEFGSDMNNSVLLNETAVKKLNIKEPVGTLWGSKTVIGVIKDFNLHSIHSEIPPLYIEANDKYIRSILVHYKTGTLHQLLPTLENEWKKITQDFPFTFSTLEDRLKDVYSGEKSLISIFTLATIFTLIIAVIGLFGLTLFVATSRTKEIGIRKVTGANERSLLVSLMNEYIILVFIATVLSIPVCFYFMSKWLNNYAYHVNIGWWVFLASFVCASIVVLGTVFIHSYKISRTNPVNALRYE